MIPIGTIAVVTKPVTCVRSRVGVNSSVSGTAITATPATPAPTTKRSSARYHQPPSGAAARAPVASENVRMPAISGRRRPKRSPARPQSDAAEDGADACAHQHERRLAEGQVPLVGYVGHDERDQEEVEQVQHGADHHRRRQQVEAAAERRLVERLAASGSGPSSAFRGRRADAEAGSPVRPRPWSSGSPPRARPRGPTAGSASAMRASAVKPEELASGRSPNSTTNSASSPSAAAAAAGGQAAGRARHAGPLRSLPRRPRAARRSDGLAAVCSRTTTTPRCTR